MDAKTFVRIRPFNPKRGYKIQRYTVFGIRFEASRGWYTVDSAVAEYLRGVKQDNNNPDSLDAFDICTEDQARELVRQEQIERIKRGERAAPVQLIFDKTAEATQKKAQEAARRGKAEPAGHLESTLGADAIMPEDLRGGDLTTADLHPKDKLPEPDELPEPQEGPQDDLPADTDDLTKIHGLGKTIQGRLNTRGIWTFEELAARSVTELEEIVGSIAKAQNFKAQAKKLR